jgi:twinkle protein
MYVPENEDFLVGQLTNISGRSAQELDEHIFIQTSNPDPYPFPRTLGHILSMAGAAAARVGIELVYIDPWNELERLKPKDQMLTDYIGESLAELKAFARHYGVAVVLVAHPTKAIMDKGNVRVPTLYDIEQSAHWANKADNGLIIQRDYENRTAAVHSVKVRRKGAGKVGTAIFKFDYNTERFIPEKGGVT